jgi:hypothetical protein
MWWLILFSDMENDTWLLTGLPLAFPDGFEITYMG